MITAVRLLMATTVKKGELPKEPFYIKDKLTEEVIDVLKEKNGGSEGFLFETAGGSESRTLDLARQYTEIKAKQKILDLTKTNKLEPTDQEPVVIELVINEGNFSILSGSIKDTDGKTFNNMWDLYNSGKHELIVDSTGLTVEQAKSLNIRIGKLGPEKKFVYKDFAGLRQGIEGNSNPNIER